MLETAGLLETETFGCFGGMKESGWFEQRPAGRRADQDQAASGLWLAASLFDQPQ